MPFKIFYAWQSDKPNNLCRGFIRRALDKAADQLNAEFSVEDAEREVEIDQDTKGVPGSPPISDTILQKINDCDAFIPDLTFSTNIGDGRPTPNPNVLIEYGYALCARGDQRIIGVLNNAFGRPEDLPFDIRHKRWPIQYSASDASDDEEATNQRREEQDRLAVILVNAIRDMMKAFAYDEPQDGSYSASIETPEVERVPSPQSPSQGTATTTEAAKAVPWDDGVVGLRSGGSIGSKSQSVVLIEGPTLSLSMLPLSNHATLTDVETQNITQGSVLPIASGRSDGWSYARNQHGSAAYTFGDDPCRALTATYLTRDGELHGVDRYHLQIPQLRGTGDEPYIPTGAVEEVLVAAFSNYIDVAKTRLCLTPPIAVRIGLYGVGGYNLAVNPRQFNEERKAGYIFEDEIVGSYIMETFDINAVEFLVDFFEMIYDRAGLERPK